MTHPCAWCNHWILPNGSPGAALTPEERRAAQSHGICVPCADKAKAEYNRIEGWIKGAHAQNRRDQ